MGDADSFDIPPILEVGRIALAPRVHDGDITDVRAQGKAIGCLSSRLQIVFQGEVSRLNKGPI